MPSLRLVEADLPSYGRPSPFSFAGLLAGPLSSAQSAVLHSVCLDVNDGERVALHGLPQSGRSSLLRLLAGRLTPSAGTCQVSGSVVAILDLEAALAPEASGRQNLQWLAGERAGEAEELTGLGDLLDVPVCFCSPGMRWRLGFAAAAVAPGEVLLVDACLAEADLAFRPRALARLYRLLEAAPVAVVAEPDLFTRCSRTVELRDGRLHEHRRAEAA
jgi:ABC-type polysaccharide/polyol phosphate transport system ATPase subunit